MSIVPESGAAVTRSSSLHQRSRADELAGAGAAHGARAEGPLDYANLAASALHERCTLNRNLEASLLTRFHSSRVPQITTWDYIKRIAKYSKCSLECFVIAIIYLDRYTERTQVPLTFSNVHRLLITATLIAVKVRDDLYYNNAYYASIGGVAPAEINALEMEFLALIQWDTWIEPNDFDRCVDQLFSRFDSGISA